MKTIQKILVAFIILLSVSGIAQELNPQIKAKIQAQINQLKVAHLTSNVSLANELYHPKLILTSQSGKKYNKAVALENIKNTFESYESSEIEFLSITDDVILTNYINERKYKDFDKGKYRLTVVWTKHEGIWQLISMQSSKVKERK